MLGYFPGMDCSSDQVTVTVSRHKLQQLQKLLEIGERAGGTALCEHKTPQGMVNSALDIAAGKIKEFVAIQNMVQRVVEDDASNGIRRSHTLYRVVVPDEDIENCTDLLDAYVENNPDCGHVQQMQLPVTPSVVLGEGLKALREVLSGQYEQAIRAEVAREARQAREVRRERARSAAAPENAFSGYAPESELVH